MVLELDIGRCVSFLVLQMGVDTRWCANKDSGPKGMWIWGRSHIDWRKKRVSGRTLAPKGVGCDLPHWLGGEQIKFIRCGNLLLADAQNASRGLDLDTQIKSKSDQKEYN